MLITAVNQNKLKLLPIYIIDKSAECLPRAKRQGKDNESQIKAQSNSNQYQEQGNIKLPANRQSINIAKGNAIKQQSMTDKHDLQNRLQRNWNSYKIS
jgi:hypothetical protein